MVNGKENTFNGRSLGFIQTRQAFKISCGLVSLLKLDGFNLTKSINNAHEITLAVNIEVYETNLRPSRKNVRVPNNHRTSDILSETC